MDKEKFYSKLGKTFQPGIITKVVLAASELMKGKKLISMTGGMYDVPSMPVAEVKRVFEEAPHEAWTEMLQYGSTTGMMSLRIELSKFMAEADIKSDPRSEIIVTTGSQEAIDLVTRVFIDPGDPIHIGKPTYLSALSSFKQAYPEFRVVSLDEQGMRPDALEEDLKKLKAEGRSPKMLYIIPSFQNPTSTMVPLERRKRILELAEEYDFLIFEDNPYGYISFVGEMPTPIIGMDGSGRTMYTSTFSKIVSPGMRIGWLAGHRDFIAKMMEAKGSISISNSLISQYAAVELFKQKVVDTQIDKMIKVYRKKRDVMLETMDAHFPKEAKWNTPRGGLFLWVEMPKKVNMTELLEEAVSRGVAYIPGSNFFATETHNHMRLNYSHPSMEDIVEGIQTLGKLLKEKV